MRPPINKDQLKRNSPNPRRFEAAELLPQSKSGVDNKNNFSLGRALPRNFDAHLFKGIDLKHAPPPFKDCNPFVGQRREDLKVMSFDKQAVKNLEVRSTRIIRKKASVQPSPNKVQETLRKKIADQKEKRSKSTCPNKAVLEEIN